MNSINNANHNIFNNGLIYEYDENFEQQVYTQPSNEGQSIQLASPQENPFVINNQIEINNISNHFLNESPQETMVRLILAIQLLCSELNLGDSIPHFDQHQAHHPSLVAIQLEKSIFSLINLLAIEKQTNSFLINEKQANYNIINKLEYVLQNTTHCYFNAIQELNSLKNNSDKPSEILPPIKKRKICEKTPKIRKENIT